MEVLVVPSEIAVPANWSGTFSVQVLKRDPDGNAFVPVETDVAWGDVPNGVELESIGSFTRLKVSPFGASEVMLSASIRGVPGQGMLRLRPSDEAGDGAVAAHAAGDLVEVLLAAGAGVDGTCVDAAHGFVGRAGIPNIREGGSSCRDEAVLVSSSRAAVRFSPAKWTGGIDLIGAEVSTGAETPTPLAQRLQIPLKVYVASYASCQPYPACSALPADDPVAAMMQDQVDFANASFELNRVGVELVYGGATTLKVTGDMGCRSAIEALANSGKEPQNGEVAALVVRDLIVTEVRALTCHPDFLDGDVQRALILMDANDQWDPSLLAHEFGHVLSLKQPEGGHVYRLSASPQPLTGIGRDNMMAEQTSASMPRFRFTLGQVHRMNFDERGLLPAAGRQTPPFVDCKCDPLAARTCPPLVRDLKPLELPSASWAGQCPSP